jgi:hypothetical protein
MSDNIASETAPTREKKALAREKAAARRAAASTLAATRWSAATAGAVSSTLNLERNVSVPEAAAQKGVSPDTFKRRYAHLIRKVSPRRNVVKLRDLLTSDES